MFGGNARLISAMLESSWNLSSAIGFFLRNLYLCRLWKLCSIIGKVTFWEICWNLCRLSIPALAAGVGASLRSLSLAGAGASQNWSSLKIHPNYFYTKNLFQRMHSIICMHESFQPNSGQVKKISHFSHISVSGTGTDFFIRFFPFLSVRSTLSGSVQVTPILMVLQAPSARSRQAI